MSISSEEEGLIRRYLLGKLTEDERQELEKRMMADDELFDCAIVTEDEMVEQYVSGELSDSERAGFEDSFLSTPDGAGHVSFARALKKYASNATARTSQPIPRILHPHRWWARAGVLPYLRSAAAAMILICLGLGIWRVFIYQSEVGKGIAALAKAYGLERPVEPRVSELPYAPLPNTRGRVQARIDELSLNRAERILLDEVDANPGKAAYHAFGRLYLAEHRFDDAILQFEKALEFDPGNARLHSDYGAALMEKGKADESKAGSSKSLEDLARALEHFDRALDLDHDSLDALFNLALCHQEMMLPMQAMEDWRIYLEKDARTGWADEAKQNLRKLEEQRNKISQNKQQLFDDFLSAYHAGDAEGAWKAFSGSRDRTGNLIVERLLDDYLDLAAEGRWTDAARNLQVLSYGADLENQRAGDRFTSDLARFYKSTMFSRRVTPLARARRLIKEASELSSKTRYEEATVSYSMGRSIFEQNEDHCEAGYADYRVGQCRLRQNGAQASLDIFERLARVCERDQHKCLLALIYNSLADAFNGISEHSKGLHYSIQALKTSEEIEDLAGAARCHIQIAIGYQKVDDYRKCLVFLQRGLALVGDSPSDPGLVWVFYDVAAKALSSLHLYAAAVDYQKEALQLAVEMGSRLNLSRSYAHLGFLYGKLGNYEKAIETAELAFDIGKSVSNEPIGREMMAYTSLYLGDLHRQKGEFVQALQYYDQNIDLYASLATPLHLYATHKGKLLCLIAQGDNAAAVGELDCTLRLFEQYRSKILEESNRNNFFDIEQNIYDTAIDFEYSKLQDSRTAFEKSEQCRARSLLDLADKDVRMINERFGPDLTLAPDSQPLMLSEIQSHLPANSQILQYAMLEDKLLIWVVSDSEISIEERPVGIAELSEKVNRYVRKVSRPSGSIEEMSRDARELYDLLILPVKRFLDKEKYLCIVPDKALNRIPFDALVSGSGNYLVDEYTLGVCPSSTIFIKRSEAARNKVAKVERAFAAGNPTFDRAAFPGLEELPSSAGEEAKGIAALYETSPLIGKDATEGRVRREMVNSDVIHLATHYVADERSYLLSAFPLAREPGSDVRVPESDGKLQVHEIYAMNLSRPRLAVLAACRTGIEKTYEGEGAISVSRPFIAAGVPVVVASLWPVESDSTAALMISFHRHRVRDHLSTSRALRLAQTEMIHGADARLHHPYYWAAFAVIGGYSIY